MTVWQIYKNRFLPTQVFILLACGAIYWFKRDAPLAILTAFFLQFAALYGSFMGKRLLDQINARNVALRQANEELEAFTRRAEPTSRSSSILANPMVSDTGPSPMRIHRDEPEDDSPRDEVQR